MQKTCVDPPSRRAQRGAHPRLRWQSPAPGTGRSAATARQACCSPRGGVADMQLQGGRSFVKFQPLPPPQSHSQLWSAARQAAPQRLDNILKQLRAAQTQHSAGPHAAPLQDERARARHFKRPPSCASCPPAGSRVAAHAAHLVSARSAHAAAGTHSKPPDSGPSGGARTASPAHASKGAARPLQHPPCIPTQSWAGTWRWPRPGSRRA